MKKKNSKQSQGMVDISSKKITKRTAVAMAEIQMGAKAFSNFAKGGSPKGNVLETARVASIMAAKNTPQMIPLCHPLSLSKVNIQFELDHKKYVITTIAEVVCQGQTGVEMEALSAVTVASLTIYDMMKWADKGMVISKVMLLKKSGGKSGDFRRSSRK